MNIETKFDLGDTVYLIRFHAVRTPKPCPDCDGAGKLTLQDGRQLSCRPCHTRGTLGFVDQKPEWFVDGQIMLGRVRVEIVRETAPNERESEFDNFGPQKASRVEEYMAYETGIGTGNNWSAEDLFAAREDAAVECEQRNAVAAEVTG